MHARSVTRATGVDRSPRHRTPTPCHEVGSAPGSAAITAFSHHVLRVATGDRRPGDPAVPVARVRRHRAAERGTGRGAGRLRRGPAMTSVQADVDPRLRRVSDRPVELVGGGCSAP